MKNIWSDNNAPELTPAGYVKVALTHNLPVFSCVSQAQYINSRGLTLSGTKTHVKGFWS